MLVYLSLGTNLGDKELNLKQARELLQTNVGNILRTSEYFYSLPWGFKSENTFVNQCLAIETPLEPMDLLLQTQMIEKEMGRTEKSVNGIYADRLIDIDLLHYFSQDGKEVIMNTPTLTLPHPLINKREFVVKPLAEIMQ